MIFVGIFIKLFLDAIPALTQLILKSKSEETHQRAIWALSNMLVSEDNHDPFIEAGGLTIIIDKLKTSQNKVKI